MSYSLEAVIGLEPAIRFAARGREHAVVAELSHGLALIPLTDRLNAELEQCFGREADPDFQGIPLGVPATARWLREASRSAFLAFICAEFFGGDGYQWAVGMENGVVVLGFLKAPDAINQVLSLLGVRAHPGTDEFDTVGLGRHRRTARWAGEPE
ncbi:MAG: hypothetical protein FD180_4803 [Planctomycetota bacterium]|nr:MAG: hypothetical protein FD180_4803 [Planctomycetota bacterium]